MSNKPYYVQCDSIDDGCGEKYPGDLEYCPKCGAATSLIAIPAHLPVDGYVYDIETYPNIFTFAIIHPATDSRWLFEISDRMNQRAELVRFLEQLAACDAEMIGYNNVHFDYPIVHFIIQNPSITVNDIYDKAMAIIKSRSQWDHMVWETDHYVKQVDLFKIRHFDNINRSTSLKALEFFMRMDSIEDLPFEPGTILNDQQKNDLISYNWHDIKATVYFWVRTLSEIDFRKGLSDKYQRSFINYNDTKIGKEYFIMQLEKAGIACFDKINGKKQPRQTIRPSINLAEVIFPYISFENPEFNRILDYFKSKVITETKGVFKNLIASIDGLDYVFGVGGLHASLHSKLITSDDKYQLIDVDVASYYPNLAISNNLFPAHLSDEFCKIYIDVYNQRKQHAKGTPENAMLKLALNGVYGDSNNIYSPFYDPFYTMCITINGQLLLCMLAEQLIKTPGLKMIQCNTDGVTYLCPHEYIEHTRAVCKWWEDMTRLTLEEAQYSRMWLKNVNSYIAEYTDGKLKMKKDYDYNLGYHQDPSALVIAKAAESHMVKGVDISQFIRGHCNKFDFCLRAKVPRASRLVMRWVDLNIEIPLQKITRYFVSNTGGSLIKISPPLGESGTYKRKNGITDQVYNDILNQIQYGTWDERIHTKNKSMYAIREEGITVGYQVTECNNINRFDWSNINYDYYIKETKKLVIK